MVTALGLIVGMVVLNLARTASSALVNMHGQGLVQMQLNAALTLVSKDAHLVTNTPASCVPPTCASPYTQDLDSAGDGQATLIMRVPSIDSSGAVLAETYDHLVYRFNAGTGILQRIVEKHAASSRLTATQVVFGALSRVLFTTSATAVTITVWAHRTEAGRAFDGTAGTSVAFRNVGM